MRDPDLEILGHKRTLQAWFNVQSTGSEAGLLQDSVSESANLTVPRLIVWCLDVAGGRGSASGEVTMRWLAMLSTLGLLVALAGCSISGECRRMGFAPGSSAYQTCVSTILQQRDQLSNYQNRMQHGGFY
jgi:hypothetical protein